MNKESIKRVTSLVGPFIFGWVIFYALRLVNSSFLMEFQILLSSLFASLFCVGILRFIQKNEFNFELVVSILLSTTLMFFSAYSTAMNIDRSKSSYLLNWIHENPKITYAELEKKLIEKYGFYDKSYIEQRILEQEKRKVFNISNGSIETTKFGDFIYSFFDLLSRVLNLQGWNRARL